MTSRLHIVSLGAIDQSTFALHFSDETCVVLTADQIAERFPNREQVLPKHENADRLQPETG